ncbi:MAG TPA: creatininase family protein [bacterium]|nr:creatininase family protein [bacterium]
MAKHRLDEMSWKEAEEAFKRSDTAIMAVGTLHSHGPTPIGIDTSSVAWIADEVGKRTGLVTLPAVPYGENDKMAHYPGSITISQDVIEAVYTDICESLYDNGVRKVIFLNGHGGNREPLIRTGRNVRELGMLIAVLEWWNIGKKIAPNAFPEGTHIWELAVALAVSGAHIADVRPGGYKGEWGVNPPMRQLFGDKIKPLGFSNFEYQSAPVIIPVDSWDVDVESAPEVDKAALEALKRRGEESLARIVDHIVAFAKDFQKLDPAKALQTA